MDPVEDQVVAFSQVCRYREGCSGDSKTSHLDACRLTQGDLGAISRKTAPRVIGCLLPVCQNKEPPLPGAPLLESVPLQHSTLNALHSGLKVTDMCEQRTLMNRQ